jgi:hypothetical protein
MGFFEGVSLPLRKTRGFLPRPFGLIHSNPPVLGAA